MSEFSAKDFYKRQVALNEMKNSGQLKLANAKVGIVGCGGLGSIAAVYLAGSGIGKIHLIDYDIVDVSNLHRQVFFRTSDIGKSKVTVLATHIESISPFVKVTIAAEKITKSNVFDLISSSDIILDCTDHLLTKYLLNDACVINDKVLVYGSLYKYDGYVATFNYPNNEGEISANLRDAFPEMSKEHIPNCSETGTLNTIVGIIGLMQANEVLKVVSGIGQLTINELLIYNSLNNSQFKMKLKSKFDKHRISTLFESEEYSDEVCQVKDSLLITQDGFKKTLIKKNDFIKIISVIEDEEQELPFKVDKKVPFYDLDEWLDELKELQKEYIFVCNRGNSSLRATYLFKEQFPEVKVLSLEGGIEGFTP